MDDADHIDADRIRYEKTYTADMTDIISAERIKSADASVSAGKQGMTAPFLG